jgi:PKD repeat protein
MKKLNYLKLITAIFVLMAGTSMAQVANFTISGNTNRCANAAFVFTNASTGATSYSWDFGDGSMASTDVSPSHSYAYPGNYIITLTATNGSNSSVVRKGVYVKGTPSIYFYWTGYGPFYTHTDVSIDNQTAGAVSYVWDFGDGTSSTTINPKKSWSTSGTKNIVLVAYNGCGDSAVYNQSIQIEDTGLVSPMASGFVSPSKTCPGGVVTFYSYSDHTEYVKFDFGDGHSLTTAKDRITYVYSEPGNYKAKLYAYNQNKVDSISLMVEVSNKAVNMPYANVSPTRYIGANYLAATCPGKPFKLDGSAADQITKSYWKLHNGTILNAMDTTVTFANEGVYPIWYMAESFCGGIDSTEIQLYVLKSDTFTNYIGGIQVSPVTGYVCPGGKMKFTIGYVPEDGFVYTWRLNNTVVSTDYSFEHVFPNTESLFNMVVTVTPQCGLEDSISRTVYTSNASNPSASFSVSTTEAKPTCYGDSVHFITSYDESYLLNPVTHLWNFGDNQQSTLAEPTHVYAMPGIYTTVHTTTNTCGVSQSSAYTTFKVAELPPVPHYYAMPASVCEGDTVLFDNFTNGADSTILDFGDGHKKVILGQSFPHLMHAYSVAGNYTTYLYVYNKCGRDTAMFEVKVLPRPEAHILMSDTSVAIGTTLTFNQNTAHSTEFVWYAESLLGDTSTAPTFSVSYSSQGRHVVYLVSYNQNGCMNMDSVVVYVGMANAIASVKDEHAQLFTYPNPAQSELTMMLQLEKSASVTIELYDMNGRLIRSVFSGDKVAGQYNFVQDISSIPSGLYICKVRVNNSIVHQKFIKE